MFDWLNFLATLTQPPIGHHLGDKKELSALHPQHGPCAYHHRARMYPRCQTAYSGKSYVWGPRQSPGKHWALRWDVRLAI